MPLDNLGCDPEIAELLGELGDDGELLELSRTLRAARPDPVVDSRFQGVLRAQLMDAASAELRNRPAARVRRVFGFRPGGLAIGSGLIGALAVVTAVATIALSHPHNVPPLALSSPLTGKPSVNLDDAITVSFNQPMDQASVTSAIEIHPATSFTTRWTDGGATLVIQPTHHLVSNTPYSVMIDHSRARSATGQRPQHDIAITFGTAPGPPVAPQPTPSTPVLATATVGRMDPGATVVEGPDGSLVVSSAPSTGDPASGPNSSPSPSGAATTTAPGSSGSQLLRHNPDGSTTALGAPVTAVAVARDGSLIAELVPDGQGGARLVVTGADGSHPATLARTDTPSSPLAVGDGEAVVYVSGGRLRSVTPQGSTRTLTPLAIPAGAPVVVAPDGHTAYIGPSGSASANPSPTAAPAATAGGADGVLVDLRTLTSHPLPGARDQVVISADGSTVAWVDHSARRPALVTAPSGGGDPTTVATLNSGATISAIALSPHGIQLADTGGGHTTIRTVTGGRIVATIDGGARELVYAPDGASLAVVRAGSSGDEVAVAAIPGAALPPATAGSDVVDHAVEQVIQAQVGNHTQQLQAMVGQGLDPSTLSVSGVTRGYIVHITSLDDRNASAEVRLIADPVGGQTTPSETVETLTLARSDPTSPYLVTRATVGQLRVDPPGPEVIHSSQVTTAGLTTVQVTLDSDIDPTTAVAAMQIRRADGSVLDATVRYDPDTRSIIAVVAAVNGQPVQVTVGTSLRDVNGTPLAAPYTVSPQG